MSMLKSDNLGHLPLSQKAKKIRLPNIQKKLLKDLIGLGAKGHIPYFNRTWLIDGLMSEHKPLDESSFNEVLAKIQDYKTYSKKQTFLLSLQEQEKCGFILKLYEKIEREYINQNKIIQ